MIDFFLSVTIFNIAATFTFCSTEIARHLLHLPLARSHSQFVHFFFILLNEEVKERIKKIILQSFIEFLKVHSWKIFMNIIFSLLLLFST
jgi:hypothetical protein